MTIFGMASARDRNVLKRDHVEYFPAGENTSVLRHPKHLNEASPDLEDMMIGRSRAYQGISACKGQIFCQFSQTPRFCSAVALTMA